ncbi:hypothetical protein CVU75_03730 [Candidatus Dependentiae bacterium HGW-Dependentiae-1]|nr:MAG: hypothetical protein CVU75_03730 [Candidatus Dependentiae bacterium HGW-Dependentiae-1]
MKKKLTITQALSIFGLILVTQNTLGMESRPKTPTSPHTRQVTIINNSDTSLCLLFQGPAGLRGKNTCIFKKYVDKNSQINLTLAQLCSERSHVTIEIPGLSKGVRVSTDQDADTFTITSDETSFIITGQDGEEKTVNKPN